MGLWTAKLCVFLAAATQLRRMPSVALPAVPNEKASESPELTLGR